MKEVLLEKVKIDGNILDISDDKIYFPYLDKKDWIIYLLFKYNDNLELIPRDKIFLEDSDHDFLKQNINKEVIIKTRAKTKIGTCIINNDLSLKPQKFYIADKYYNLNEYNKLFKHYVSDTETDNLPEIEFQKYISGLFKIYYDSIKYLFSMNNTTNIRKKITAMASYRAIRDNLTNYNVSEPNVFIKNHPLEYDALILKKAKNDEYYYEVKDVQATIEIKSAGYRGSQNEISNYIKHIVGTDILEERITGINHIYFAIFEQPKNYQTIIKKMHDATVIVCASKINNNTFLIPKEYDINAILTKI